MNSTNRHFIASRSDGQEASRLLAAQREERVARDDVEETLVPDVAGLAGTTGQNRPTSAAHAEQTGSSALLQLSENPLQSDNDTTANNSGVAAALTLIEAKAAIAAASSEQKISSTNHIGATPQVQLITLNGASITTDTVEPVKTESLVEIMTCAATFTTRQNAANETFSSAAATSCATTQSRGSASTGTHTDPQHATKTLLDAKAAIAALSAAAALAAIDAAAASATTAESDIEAHGLTKHDPAPTTATEKQHTTHEPAMTRLQSSPQVSKALSTRTRSTIDLVQRERRYSHSRSDSSSSADDSDTSFPTVATALAVSAFVVGTGNENVANHDTLDVERERFRQQIRAGMAAEIVVASPAEPVDTVGISANDENEIDTPKRQAAQTKGTSPASRRFCPTRRRLIRWAFSIVVLVVVLALTVASIVATRQPRLGRQSSSSSSPTGAPLRESDSPSSVDEAAGSTVPAVFLPDGRQAFTETLQLYQAVDDYAAAMTTNGTAQDSLVAQQYGYPMGTWDVSRLTNFSSVFMSNRLQKLTYTVRFDPVLTLTIPDLSGWDVSRATTMKGMFAGSTAFTGEGLADWNVSLVTDFSFCFFQATEFVGSLSNWKTTSARIMNATFFGANSFNGDLSNWNVARVESTAGMFSGAFKFQGGDLSRWNVSRVRDMRNMFSSAFDFTGNVSTWNTEKVESMAYMFQTATAFNGDLSRWKVGKVSDFEGLFLGAHSFEGGDLSAWNKSRVTNMVGVFKDCDLFTGSVSTWDVSRVSSFESSFEYSIIFRGDLSQWKTGRASSMKKMFLSAYAFNGYLSTWDVSNVADMFEMFHSAQAFNGDLSTWNVSSVQDASRMFNEAFVFNHSLCSWRDKLPVDAVVTDMFNLSACAFSNEPLLTAATSANVLEPWSGPFCSVCNDSDK